MTETRKLAAILAADVVGYSRLMGEDEAGTARAVSEHRQAARPIIAGLGGRIVKTTGDGLLLEFPSIVAGVECAIAFTYKGKHVDAKQIGRELNVRYILEGSVQRAGAPDARQYPADRRRERQTSLGGAVRQAGRRSLRHAG